MLKQSNIKITKHKLISDATIYNILSTSHHGFWKYLKKNV